MLDLCDVHRDHGDHADVRSNALPLAPPRSAPANGVYGWHPPPHPFNASPSTMPLRRFDLKRGVRVKDNSRFEFAQQLDMQPYASEDVPRAEAGSCLAVRACACLFIAQCIIFLDSACGFAVACSHLLRCPITHGIIQ